jgi:mannonate dehydratase
MREFPMNNQIKVQQIISSNISDEELLFWRQMGLAYVSVQFTREHSNYDAIMSLKERLSRYGLIIADAGSRHLYKNPAIHLGLPDRDAGIEQFNEFTRLLGKADIPVGFMTWEPDGVLNSGFGVGEHTRGALSRLVDIREMEQRPYTHGREYPEEEIWANFKYFLDAALPVCEEANVKIALHPNDPPVPMLVGIYNLIHSAADYERAFALAGNSPYLGMKMCIGCWLEGGTGFGDVLEDIDYFCREKKVLSIHFRNVSAPVPYFEETILEDGYMDMYRVMRQLVQAQYDGFITVDHVPEFVKGCGGKCAAYAYSIGYMKALIRCAQVGEAEVKGMME